MAHNFDLSSEDHSIPPILFLVFNRPEETARVFDAIRNIRPSMLYVAADGPRPERLGEKEKCENVRQIATQIDWDCTVKTLFRDHNLGCQKAVSSAIDWFFENEPEGIILEDDCLPSPSFFPFCQELLSRYRSDERIMMISGDNFQPSKRTPYSYYFSKYPHVWGWATWRRAWASYDVKMTLWPEISNGRWLKDMFPDKSVELFWRQIFDATHAGDIDTWDYQLTFATAITGRLCILPERNLVSNIGFGMDATHTKGKSKLANNRSENLDLPLCHPPFLIRNAEADARTEKAQFTLKSGFLRALAKFKRICRGM